MTRKILCPECGAQMRRAPDPPPAYPRFSGQWIRRWVCQNQKCAEFGRAYAEGNLAALAAAKDVGIKP